MNQTIHPKGEVKKMEEEIKIGQEKIFMQPVNVFDCIIIDYEKVKIIKVHKKSVKIKLIEECGVGHGTTLISFEKLKNCYFNSMEDAVLPKNSKCPKNH